MPQTQTQPPRREMDAQIAVILERMGEQDKITAVILSRMSDQDKLLVELKAQNECILEGINGTVQVKGLAGRVRDLEDWRARADATLNRIVWYVIVPLMATLLLAVLGFLWALVTHSIEVVLH